LALLVPGVAYADDIVPIDIDPGDGTSGIVPITGGFTPLPTPPAPQLPVSVVSAFGSGCTTDSVHASVKEGTNRLRLKFDSLGAILSEGSVFARSNCVVTLQVDDSDNSSGAVNVNASAAGIAFLGDGVDATVSTEAHWQGDAESATNSWPITTGGSFRVRGSGTLADPYDGGRYLQLNIAVRLRADSPSHSASTAVVTSSGVAVQAS
jgi:hypothetical protein